MALKVLLIDSITYNRKQLQRVIAADNFETDEAPDLKTGIVKCAGHPDIITIGISVLNKNGDAAIKQLAQRCPEAALIVHSVYSPEEEIDREEKLKRLGANAIIHMPLNEKEVLDAVRSDYDSSNEDGGGLTAEMVEGFVAGVSEAITELLGEEVMPGKGVSMQAAFTTQGIAAVTDYFYKKQNGSIMLDMDPDTALLIAEKRTGSRSDEITNEVKKEISDFSKHSISAAARGLTTASGADKVIVSLPKIYTDNLMKEVKSGQDIFVYPLAVHGKIINLSFFISHI